MKVFHASITYLTLLFVAVAVDVFLRCEPGRPGRAVTP